MFSILVRRRSPRPVARRSFQSSRRSWLRSFERLEVRSLFATFTVNSLLDTVDANPGDGVAQDAAGMTSLRAAIMEANARAGEDSIILPAGEYKLALAGANENGAATGDLDVAPNGRLIITGSGAATTVIDAAELGDRVFHVLAFANLVISAVNVRNGDITDAPVGQSGDGGGFLNSGTLSITNSVISANEARDFGGGVANAAGGTLTITDSTVAANLAPAAAGVFIAMGNATLTQSTVSNNSAAGGAGGIFNVDGAMTIVNSTISGNSAQGNGGGITNTGELMIRNSTIADNTAGMSGGGVYNTGAGTATVQNSIVAGNNVVGMGPADFSGVVSSLGNNLICDTSGSSGWVASDLQNVDPLLGPLADNGGLTQTHALLTGSPAIDAGNNTSAPAADQRGAPFVRIFNGTIDIGAFERQSLIFVADSSADEDDGNYAAGDFSLREAIALANVNPGHDTILPGPPVTLALGELLITSDLTITGPGTISGNNISRVLNIAASTTVNVSQLTIRNGRAIEGGAIYNSGTLSIAGSIVTGSTASNSLGAGGGGGIFNAGTLTIHGSTILANSARVAGGGILNSVDGTMTMTGSVVTGNIADSGLFGAGGGIANFGDLEISGSTISNNTAATLGGGIQNVEFATLTIVQSTIAGNSATGFALPIRGGGVNNRGAVTIADSTISGNAASPEGSSGGGIYNQAGTLTVTNSTISGNSANQTGGIYNNAELTIKHSTITANATNMFVGPPSEGSGGITNSSSGTVTVQNTIIARNVAGTAGGTSDFFGNAGSLGDNLIGDTAGSSGWMASDLKNVNPHLGPLADNGGPTMTHALLADSPAVDAGNNAGAPSTDQRGEPFVRIANGMIDIGAYERQSLKFVVDTTVDENDGNYGPGDLSLREAIALANANPGRDVTQFAEVLAGATITLAMGELSISSDLTLTGTDADQLTISGGDTSRILNVSAAATADIIGLTISNGINTFGGGILNSGTLALDNIELSKNSAAAKLLGEAQQGGGIYNSGILTITNSTISNNVIPRTLSVVGEGAGIWNRGQLLIIDTAISGNSTIGPGGGIYNSEEGSVTIVRSNISANLFDSSGNGGGIWNRGDLIIRETTISDHTGASNGGGIWNVGNATVEDSLIARNSAAVGFGGGIYNRAEMIVRNSTFTGNTAATGGGMHNANSGSLIIMAATLTDNSAGNFGGGGIYTAGMLEMIDSTISTNSAANRPLGRGGAIDIAAGKATVTNSTLSGNVAYTAGAIANAGDLTIKSSTIAANTGGVAMNGGVGGVLNSSSGKLTLQNTIIAGNTGSFILPGDTAGSVTSLGHNLIGVSGSSGWVDTDMIGTAADPLDAGLGALSDNGGPTLTHALLPDSAAIDAGSTAGAPTTDQRGIPRPWDGDLDGLAVADIGAFELTEPVETFLGTEGSDVFLVTADVSSTMLQVFTNEDGSGEPVFSALLASSPPLLFDTLAGDDRLFVDADTRFIEFKSGADSNTLTVRGVTARIRATADANGTLATTLSDGAELITRGFQQSSLTIGADSRATILPDGSDAATSILNSLTTNAGGTLDINDNALVVDYTGDSPAATIRTKVVEGRGGVGLGQGKWTGTGITSSIAQQVNATMPEARSVAYAENALLPLGPYTTFRGQPVDDTSVLIAYTRTADANLDGAVNDDDVTIVGATYAPGVPQPHWALGDFDYNGFVDDDDVTLLGAFYEPAAAPPLSAPVAAASIGWAEVAEAHAKSIVVAPQTGPEDRNELAPAARPGTVVPLVLDRSGGPTPYRTRAGGPSDLTQQKAVINPRPHPGAPGSYYLPAIRASENHQTRAETFGQHHVRVGSPAHNPRRPAHNRLGSCSTWNCSTCWLNLWAERRHRRVMFT